MDQNELKQLTAQESIKYIKNGMTVGLGSGSTVKYMVDALGKSNEKENLNLTCVTTSLKTAKQATAWGLVVKDIDQVGKIDLTIDGADEVDSELDGIKGGGAALLWEKIVAKNSKRNIWIVDESKVVQHLGKFPLPVEVIPFGCNHLFQQFEKMNLHPQFRKNVTSALVRTDSNNLIIDLKIGKVVDPIKLAQDLKSMTGVVEHGLFIDVVDTVVIGSSEGVKIINRN